MFSEMASDGARTNEKYLCVVKEGEKFFAGLEEMTKADDLRELQARGAVVEKDPPIQVQVTHPDGYDTLQDPDVAVSKGHPRGRFLTTREKFLAKQQNACSHCNKKEHNIAGCHNLHIDKSHFKKKKATPKKIGGAAGASSKKQNVAKRQRKKGPTTEVEGVL